jgi:hypothetical protein
MHEKGSFSAGDIHWKLFVSVLGCTETYTGMSPPSKQCQPDDLRDALVACHSKEVSVRAAPNVYKVSSRQLRDALADLEAIGQIRMDSNQPPLMETENQKQVYRWATKYTKACCPHGSAFTAWELQQALLADITKTMKRIDALAEYGISNVRYFAYMQKLLKSLDTETAKELRS